jgi:hypothetical protein
MSKPAPALAPAIRKRMAALNRGRGFVPVKGLPVVDYSTEELEIAYRPSRRHLGVPVPQVRAGHLLGRMREPGDIHCRTEVEDGDERLRQGFAKGET